MGCEIRRYEAETSKPRVSKGLGFRDQGLGIRVKGLGFRD